MQIFELKYLVGALIGIDILFFAIIIRLLNRFRYIKNNASMGKEVETFETLIKDADKMAAQFNKELEEKYHFINKLNDKLDKRIDSLKLLINRSDIILSHSTAANSTGTIADNELVSHQKEILNLAKQGLSEEEIAQKLSIQRGEVTLVLNMK